VIKYSPQLEEAFHRRKRPVCTSWRMDETYIKVKGEWRYRYRAVDKYGETIDFLLTEHRDKEAALRFLKKAIRRNGVPETITIDGSDANEAAIKSYNEEHGTHSAIRQVKYLNNIVALIGSRALSQLHPGSIGIMRLLTSSWSNPMKHLIPYLQDDQKAADYLRQGRWPDGVTCPRCGSDAVTPRERCDNGLQRFNCVHCAGRLGQQFAIFTDWTSSIFEESKLRPLDWLLVMGLWQLKLNATEIAAAANIQERTAQRCINLLDGGISETYHLEPTRQLEHQVEADECYQSAGSKGLAREVERHERAPRQRGIQLRGRATAETGRPPLLGLVQRRDKTDQDAPAAQVYLEVLENVRTTTIKPIIAAKVKSGAQFFTDEYNIYRFTKADYDHRTVNHGAGEYARRDPDGTCVHCNTMEGIWASLRNFWTASRVSANAFSTSASHATSSCTTMDTCPGVRPSKQPCDAFSRPRAIIGGG